MASSNFTISSVFIIESLPANEVQTGTQLSGYIKGLDLPNGVELHLCRLDSGDQLIALLNDILSKAEVGTIPIIHFETHGTFDGRGLVTANLDVVPWSDISKVLLCINIATRFNLVVFVAACNGGYFLEEMKIIAPTPCYALVAPTDEVNPGEIMGATRDFYRILLSTADATKAVASIEKQQIQQGRWFARWAENWYRMVVINHIQAYCTPKALKERAREMRATASTQGLASDMGQLKKQLKASTRVDLVGKYFDRFFCTDVIPENVQRFEYLRTLLSSEIDQFLAKSQA